MGKKKKKKVKAQQPKPKVAKTKKKKKSNPINELLKQHPDLTKDTAAEIVEAGITYEEWQAQKEAKREERRRANQARMVQMILQQHPEFKEKHALEMIQLGMSPEEYKEHREKKRQEYKRKKLEEKRKRAEDKRRKAEILQARKEKIELLLEYHPDMNRSVAGQIASGNLTYEKYRERLQNKNQPKTKRPVEQIEAAKRRIQERKQKLEERVALESHLGENGDNYFQNRIADKQLVKFVRFHNPSMYGEITRIEPFRLILKTERNPSSYVVKRHCAIVYRLKEEQEVISQVQVALEQAAQKQYPPREPKDRYIIPEEWLERGQAISLLLHNGFLIWGMVLWADRFQLMLQLPNDREIFVFRHAVHLASQEELEGFGEHIPLNEFIQSPPALPEVHPESVPPTEIIVPAPFDDYPVKDELYDKYLIAFDKGSLELEPLKVRKEGNYYVLLDGYRRLTLALEKELDNIPIEVN